MPIRRCDCLHVVHPSMKGKTNPGIMERHCAAGIHSGVARLQPDGQTGTRMTTCRAIGNPCVWSVLWIPQPLFTEGAALCRRLVWRGRRGEKAQKMWQKASTTPFPLLGRYTNISPPPFLPPDTSGAAKSACLNSRGCRLTPTCATDSPTLDGRRHNSVAATNADLTVKRSW